MTLRIRLLGPVQISQNNQPLETRGRKPLALLAYLLLTRRYHSRQHLVDLLFDRAADPRANLRWALSELRRAIGVDYILADRHQIGFNWESDYWLDVEALEQGQTDLYRGDFLEGFTVRDAFGFEEWALFERERLSKSYQSALTQQLEASEQSGDHQAVIETAHQLLQLDNLCEAWYRALMRAYACQGQREAALAQFEQCYHILQAEMDLEPATETVALAETIREGEIETPHSSAPPQRLHPLAPRHNLPAQTTSFIGREEELGQITDHLANPDCRLLTLVGPGGIGKTRLAIQAAAEIAQLAKFPQGVYFVALAPVSSPEFIVSAVAEALNFTFFGQAELKVQLLNYLRPKKILLILDNFEHLLDGTNFVLDILDRAGDVKLLVTSRERLNLSGEWLLNVRGLLFPAVDQIKTTPPGSYSAVQLFLQRATRLEAGFTLSADNEPYLVRICQLVEGMPLGIELAASWTRTLTCRQIVQEIVRDLGFLSTSLRDVPARHRSLKAIFDHSWKLLLEEERAVFRRMAVFRGGFRRDAAEQVTGTTLPVLSSLVDKSFLRLAPSGRYEIHELLRQFAAKKLVENPAEKDAVENSHGHYYMAFLQQREDALIGPAQKEALAEIRAEIENVRAAWRWAIDRQKIKEIGRSAESLFRYYVRRSSFQEGEDAFQRAVVFLRGIKAPPQSDPMLLLGKILARQGVCCSYRFELEQARKLLNQSLDIFYQGGASARKELGFALMHLGDVVFDLGEYLEAQEIVQKSLAIHHETGNQWGIAFSLSVLSYIAYTVEDYPKARQMAQESLKVFSDLGDRWGIAYSQNAAGLVAYLMGDYAEAKRHLQECIVITREFNDKFISLIALTNLARVALAVGNFEEAKRLLQEEISIARERGLDKGIFCRGRLSQLARIRGEYREAKRLAAESLALAKKAGHRRAMGSGLCNLGVIAYLQGEYPEAEQLLQKSLSVRRDIGYHRGVAESLGYLGQLAAAQDEPQKANNFFSEALQIAATIQARAIALNVLSGIAELLVKAEEIEPALELLSLIRRHPSTEQETKVRAKRLLTALETRLTPDCLTKAEVGEPEISLEAVAAETLQRLSPAK